MNIQLPARMSTKWRVSVIHRRKNVLVVTLAACGLALAVSGALGEQSAKDRIQAIDPAGLSHTPIPAFPGVANTFLTGAFNKPGLYAAHGKMSKGAKFPPHSHPDVRLSVVMSGTMYLGEGETFDVSKLVAYPAGTVAITPPNTPHYMYAKDGDVTILEIGSGPSGASFTEK